MIELLSLKVFLVYLKFANGVVNCITRPQGYKTISCSTQLNMKIFLLINVKMPTVVGILTFLSRKNSTLGLSEPEKKLNSMIFFILMSI